jgi:hypothetical protein
MIDASDSSTAPLQEEWDYSRYSVYLTFFFVFISVYVGAHEVLLVRAAHASPLFHDAGCAYYAYIRYLAPWAVALSCWLTVRRAAIKNTINPKAEYLCYFSIDLILLTTYPVITSLYSTSIRC